MGTLEEIARRAEVSAGTVSRVLNGRSKEAWPSSSSRAKKIRQIAAELNYRPSASARAMASQRTRQVGVLACNAPDPINRYRYLSAYEMILGINEYLQAEDHLLCHVRVDDVNDPAEASRVFREKVVDAMVVIDAVPERLCRRIQRLVPHCVWLEANRFKAYHCIRRDELHTGRTVARALVEAGYRRLFWIQRPNDPGRDDIHFSKHDRLAGLLEVVEPAGVSVEPVDVPLDSMRELQDLTGRLRPDDAVVAFNLNLATRMATLASRFEMVPGRDFGLASCDDSKFIAENWPDLARMHVDRFELGREAARMVLQMLDGRRIRPKSKQIQAQWIEGRTAPGPGRFRPAQRESAQPGEQGR